MLEQKYIFKQISTENGQKQKEITVETYSVSLHVILQDIADFLSACGFRFPNCDYPIVINDEENEDA